MISGNWRRYTGSVLKRWREDAGMKQTDLGIEIGYDRVSISKFESGASDWTGYNAMLWATACGLDPYSAWGELAGPEIVTDDRERLCNFIRRGASERLVQCLCFMCLGRHGSDVEAIFEKGVADMQSDMQGRVSSAGLILANYEYARATGRIAVPDGIQPDVEALQRALSLGRSAAFSGAKYYKVKEGGKE